jgi:WhiB family transcriptional regulator, redox-sensing transcriptional regulator
VTDLERDDWRDLAACKAPDVRPEWFFPVGEMYGRDVRPALYAQARAVCARCPVTEECLAYALKAHMVFGVFGGQTPVQRRRIGKLCVNGHALVPGNVFIWGGEKRCRACKCEAQKRYRDRLRSRAS